MTVLKRFFTMSLLTLLVSSIALAGCTRQAPDAAAADYREAIEIARTEIWQDINTGKASSATVAIMDNGKIVYAEGFGMADRENSISVDTETVFNMGSVSKTFCSVAVMLLVDDGKVKLDDPVMNYVTDFTMADPRYKDITVRMLLNHTSGIPGTTWANTFGYSSNPTVYEDTLNNLSRSNLKHAPGAAAPYCNDGFTLAEILVTRVSGQTFIDFLSQRIFKPLSLNHTGLSVGEVKDHVAARYYNPENGAAVPLEVLSILGAGGLSTTASDLVKFADSFSEKGKQILSPASIAEMIKASPSPFAVKAMQETGINPEMDYGLGLDVAGLPVYQQKDIYVIGKGGDTNDYHSLFLSDPQRRISVAVLEAGHGASAMKITVDIFNAVLIKKGLLEKSEDVVSKPDEPQTIPSGYTALAGLYNPGYRIAFDPEMKACILSVLSGGKEVPFGSMTYRNGFFTGTSGIVYRLLSVDGQDCLMVNLPGLDINIVVGQKIHQLEGPLSLKIDIDGQLWLRRDSKPFESAGTTLIGTSYNIEGMPGYAHFNGIYKVESPVFAGMASNLMRDLKELELIDKNGQTWIRNSDTLFSPASAAGKLKIGLNAVTIGSDAFGEWLIAENEVIVSFGKSEGARVVVLSSEGTLVYDSMLDTGDAYIPEGGLIMLAGNPGDSFTVTAR